MAIDIGSPAPSRHQRMNGIRRRGGWLLASRSVSIQLSGFREILESTSLDHMALKIYPTCQMAKKYLCARLQKMKTQFSQMTFWNDLWTLTRGFGEDEAHARRFENTCKPKSYSCTQPIWESSLTMHRHTCCVMVGLRRGTKFSTLSSAYSPEVALFPWIKAILIIKEARVTQWAWP